MLYVCCEHCGWCLHQGYCLSLNWVQDCIVFVILLGTFSGKRQMDVRSPLSMTLSKSHVAKGLPFALLQPAFPSQLCAPAPTLPHRLWGSSFPLMHPHCCSQSRLTPAHLLLWLWWLVLGSNLHWQGLTSCSPGAKEYQERMLLRRSAIPFFFQLDTEDCLPPSLPPSPSQNVTFNMRANV